MQKEVTLCKRELPNKVIDSMVINSLQFSRNFPSLNVVVGGAAPFLTRKINDVNQKTSYGSVLICMMAFCIINHHNSLIGF